MWFTESSWPPIAICILVAGLLAFRWSMTHRGVHLGGALLLVGLSVGIYFVEVSIVTESELIEENVHQLGAAVVANDRPLVLSFFSPRAEKIRARVASAMVAFIIQDDMRITDLSVGMDSAETIATSHFRANGTIVGAASQMGGRGATRWQLTWQREAGEWKITEVIRLHPIRDEPLGMTDAVN